MKHHLRKEKICLNCGTEISERFCSHCGQENLEPKESVSHLVSHFFGDVTHYDSKFLTTIKYLLFKPGFLSRQYFDGKRTKYLNPIRMYIFISFVFFLVLFFKKKEEPVGGNEQNSFQYSNLLKQHIADSLRKSLRTSKSYMPGDSIRDKVISEIASRLDTPVVSKVEQPEAIGFALGSGGINFTLEEKKYNNVGEYDSVQRSLPDSIRDKGFLRWIIRTNVSLKSRYGSRSQVVVSENFEHSIPKLMFLLLPLFAWFVYIFHSRKRFYYSQHAIFSIHFHSFVFLLFLMVSLLSWSLNPIKIGDWLALGTMAVILIYLVMALKNTYGQSIVASIIKSISIVILYIIALILGIVALAFISFVTA